MYEHATDYDHIYMSRTYDPNGFNILHGIVRLTDETRSLFEIERAPDNLDIVLDNVSFSKMICNPSNLAMNADLEEGDSRYWDTWGEKTKLAVVPGYKSGNALMSFGREHYSHGQAQIINTDCGKQNCFFHATLYVPL